MRHEAIDKELSRIMQDYWADFRAHLDKGNVCVVQPSVPVIWFGDIVKYMQSPLKIVTVALNPSKQEFPRTARFSKFKGCEKICGKTVLDGNDQRVLFEALSSYFRCDPYKKWFCAFEKPLNALGASYYETGRDGNVAIHIDMCTALATDPTWGKLNKEQRSEFLEESETSPLLFRNLLGYLKPDVVLYSANKKMLYKVFDLGDSDIDKCYPNEKEAFRIDTYFYKDILVVKGRNNRGRPFGLKGEVVRNAMLHIKDYYKKVFSR